jgi:Holliday junction resolvase
LKESQFKAFLVKALRACDCFVQTIETTTGRGVPDLVALRSSRTYWIEVKVGYGNTVIIRPEQYAWMRRAKSQNVDVYVAMLDKKTDELKVFVPSEAKALSKGWKLESLEFVFPKRNLTKQITQWIQ